MVFTSRCVFVVRARSFEAFVSPPLLPPENISEPHYAAACHRFGWLDGVAVSERRQLPSQTDDLAPISILIRAESDDPWSSNMHTVDLYTLDPDPTYTESRSDTPSSRGSSESPVEAPPAASRDRSPYLFPPAHVASFPSARGHLRCTDIHLGPHGTAVWIQPRPARNLDLTALDVHSSDTQGTGIHPLTGARIVRQESLVGALLPGLLRDCYGVGAAAAGGDELRTLWGSSGTLTSLDYDESRGLIALGDSSGMVTVLRL